MTAQHFGGLFLGGPWHGKLVALEDRRQVVEVAEQAIIDWRVSPEPQGPAIKLHHYHRRQVAGRYPLRALLHDPLGYFAEDHPYATAGLDTELSVDWDVYVRLEDAELADQYLAMVCFTYAVTGRLATGGPAPVNVTTNRTGAESYR